MPNITHTHAFIHATEQGYTRTHPQEPLVFAEAGVQTSWVARMVVINTFWCKGLFSELTTSAQVLTVVLSRLNFLTALAL